VRVRVRVRVHGTERLPCACMFVCVHAHVHVHVVCVCAQQMVCNILHNRKEEGRGWSLLEIIGDCIWSGLLQYCETLN